MSSMNNPITFNGKTYNSLDEMPPDVRAQYSAISGIFADKNQNGVPDIMENLMSTSTVIQTGTIIYDGKTYNNINDLPPEARAKYEAAMGKLVDADHDGVPDVIENAVKNAPMLMTTNFTTGTPKVVMPTPATTNLGPIIVLAIISIGLALVVGLLLLLLLTKGGQ
jgi:hypothetical protein